LNTSTNSILPPMNTRITASPYGSRWKRSAMPASRRTSRAGQHREHVGGQPRTGRR
jgi:hypothetical protein